MAKDYYMNAQGFQLLDFMMRKNKFSQEACSTFFTVEEGFLTLNAVKYAIRAGLKEGATFADDMQKFSDYVEALVKLDYDRDEIVKTVNGYADAFKEWDGTDEYLEELFTGGKWIV